MSLYPKLTDPKFSVEPSPATLAAAEADPQKIGEVEALLRSEVETRSCLYKKYSKAVNICEVTRGLLGASCVVTDVTGTGLSISGFGIIPGVALEVLSCIFGAIDIIGMVLSKRFSAKAAKHEAVRVLASSKLNTIHSHVLKALEDDFISENEYKLILKEIEKYRAMKGDIQSKSVEQH